MAFNDLPWWIFMPLMKHLAQASSPFDLDINDAYDRYYAAEQLWAEKQGLA